MTMLQVSDLSKSFAGRMVLDIDQLQLERGQIILLIGANGAGKTTLLRMLANLPGAGGTARLRWHDTPVSSLQAGRDVTYLHQHPYLLARNVQANIEYVLRLRDKPASEVRQILAWAELDQLATKFPAELSVGQQRLVAIARMYATSAPLVLLDEPTANLDDANINAVWKLVSVLANEQRCVVVSATRLPTSLSHHQLWRLSGGRIKIS